MRNISARQRSQSTPSVRGSAAGVLGRGIGSRRSAGASADAGSSRRASGDSLGPVANPHGRLYDGAVRYNDGTVPTTRGADHARYRRRHAAVVGPTSAVRAIWPRFGAACVALARRARGFVEFYNSNNLTFAASIAYYTLLSLFPFLLLVLSIVSRVAVGPSRRGSEHAASA